MTHRSKTQQAAYKSAGRLQANKLKRAKREASKRARRAAKRARRAQREQA